MKFFSGGSVIIFDNYNKKIEDIKKDIHEGITFGRLRSPLLSSSADRFAGHLSTGEAASELILSLGTTLLSRASYFVIICSCQCL